jgi:guanylate kinase
MSTEHRLFDISNRTIGSVVVVSAPSGTGKTTLCRKLIDAMENAVFSVSLTSRPPRSEEVNGRDYHFVSREEFMREADEGGLLEWAEVYGNCYGTRRMWVEEKIRQGKYVILDIDVQGGVQIKEKMPDALLIFVIPPSMEELKNRLVNRRQDTESQIETRLRKAKEEMDYGLRYDYLVLNDELGRALERIKCIIVSHRCRIMPEE